ncbi:MAG: methionine--tRNA ligase [Bacteroidaceae bacterium]|nr:methionine--tRNA ligase [Bacteroidaceae bacterium]
MNTKKDFKRTLVTAALPYANGGVHIGHLSGVYVPADIYVRYLRLKGEEVLFICGSDEHGVPVTMRARKEGCTPQDVVDRYNRLIKESFEQFGISFDTYGRTTSPTHHRVAAEFFHTLYDKGVFLEKESEQYYDEEAKTFLADRYIVGECPRCHHEGAYGDQCEHCGSALSPTELINPHSTVSGSTPVLRKTKHWYLPLDKYQEWLEEWILQGHKEWRSNVYGQCKSWLDGGLLPRAVSRDLDWGIPVPVEGAEGKVLYVWFDAPIGYISNTIDLRPDDWQTWWKDESTRLVHFIGKDNIVFHCIVFPVMLKAEGSYILPDQVPANEFLNLEDNKISTSKNYAVWLHDYLKDFPGKEDVLRYVLTANAPETKDNNFTWKDFQARNNNELVAVYGNFVNRALQLTKKYYDGVVPSVGELTDYDQQTISEFRDVKSKVEQLLNTFHFRDAQKEAMELARIGNKYLAESEPWKVIKTDPDRVRTILNLSLQLVANLSIAFEPFLPFSSKRLRDMLQLPACVWADLGRTDILKAGHQLAAPELLFEKIDDEVVDTQVQKLADMVKANELAAWKPEPIAETVNIDDFAKLDIRVGLVKDCIKVPKKDKLLQFTIDDGLGGRAIVSGIAQHYQPQELIGKEVLFIANLAPRKFGNVVSQGMILSALNADGKLSVTGLDREVKPGCKVQ